MGRITIIVLKKDMVIYLHRKNELFLRVFILFLLVIIIWGGGYIISYLRYNDYDITMMEALKVQNQLLQEEIDSVSNLKAIKGDYLIGKVIFRNIHEFYSEIVVNLGSEDGISIGDAVLNSDGLIGIVNRVDNSKSYVKLLSGDYNVSVKVNDIYGNLNDGKITLLDKFSKVNKGDKVYTSGYGEIAENIYIGQIEEITSDKENLGQIAKVKLLDNHNLNYVAILSRIK